MATFARPRGQKKAVSSSQVDWIRPSWRRVPSSSITAAWQNPLCRSSPTYFKLLTSLGWLVAHPDGVRSLQHWFICLRKSHIIQRGWHILSLISRTKLNQDIHTSSCQELTSRRAGNQSKKDKNPRLLQATSKGVPNLPSILTRSALTRVLERAMARSYEKLREELELEVGQNLPKSYVLEADGRTPESIVAPSNAKIKLEPTRDTTLFRLRVRRDRGAAQDQLFYLDIIHDRFWTLHTLAKSEVSDAFVSDLVDAPRSGLDYLWLPRGMMEGLGDGGPLRGFSLKYRSQFENQDSDEVPIESMSMRLWGKSAGYVLDTLNRDEFLQHAVSLTSVGIRRGNGRDFAIDDVTHQGKFTTRGTAVSIHFQIMNQVQKTYLSMLKAIEECRALTVTEEGGTRLEGEPLTIVFSREIERIEDFLMSIFSSRKPFRLWGLWRFIEPEFAKVAAVDLHSGSRVDLEVSPEWMRLFLHQDSCGNTALRLLANLQHHLDSGTRLEVPGHETIV